VKLSAIISLVFVVLSQTPVFGQTPLADSLQQVVLHHPHDTTGIKALVLLASEAGRQDLGRVKTCAFQALQIAKSLKTQFGLSGIYTHLTNYYSNSGMPDSARYYLYQMKLLQEEHPEDKNIGGNYHLTAGLFYKNKGEYEEALSHMLKALTFMNTPEYHPTKAGQLLNIGNTYSHLGELQRAFFRVKKILPAVACPQGRTKGPARPDSGLDRTGQRIHGTGPVFQSAAIL
jgi:tetratricopeptide (TPR) repeat protein